MCADFTLFEDGDSDVTFAEVVGNGAADDAASDDEDVGGMFHGVVISKNSYSLGVRKLYHFEFGTWDSWDRGFSSCISFLFWMFDGFGTWDIGTGVFVVFEMVAGFVFC